MTDQLLPCPFCGSTLLKYEFSNSQGYVVCRECLTQGPCAEAAADPICDDNAAFVAWNTRWKKGEKVKNIYKGGK